MTDTASDTTNTSGESTRAVHAGVAPNHYGAVTTPIIHSATFVYENTADLVAHLGRKARGEPEVSAPEFLKLSKLAAAKLRIDPDMLKRPLNVGFSGGEKKRLEIYQMLMLEPRFMILDETDSGLDIDALKVVAEGVNALRGPGRGMLVITHYQRLLDYIKPDRVHILARGAIVASGGPELALELERDGYDKYLRAA